MITRNRIREILIPYSQGEMHFNNAVKLLGGGVRREIIIRQWMSGKMSFAECVDQLHELSTDKQ